MAWTQTIDEQDTGLDAPFAFETTFRLASGVTQTAYGLLTPTAGNPDGDLYSLGTLFKGAYTLTASLSNWYSGSGYEASITPSVAIYASTSVNPVKSGSGSVTFTLGAPGTYYAGVIGSADAASQYQFAYEWQQPVDKPPQAQVGIAGDPIVGRTLAPDGWFVEPDGVTFSYRAYRWLANDAVVGSAQTLQVNNTMLGSSLVLEVDYFDDAGYLTTLTSNPVAVVAADASSPTIQITPASTDLGRLPSTQLTFTLSVESTDFTVDDVQVTGGTLRDFAGTGRSYSAQFIPEAGRVGDAIISVPSGAFSNASGVFNQDGADANNRVSVVYDASAPRLQWADDVSVVQAPVVAFETSVGSFVIEIDAEKAPLTASNVLAYVQDGFYEGVIFHRSIPGFMVQGGGFDASGIYGQPTYDPVPLEADNGLLNVRASVAMARTSDPNSATSQFYVNLVDNAFLDGNYTVFGTVVSGMDTVDVMAAIPTGALRPIGAEGQSLSDYPMQDVTILHAEQTMPGRAVSEQAGTVLSLLDLDMLDASTPVPWRYSLDSGATWQPGEGTSLPVPEGQYPLGSIQVRYEAAPGVAGVDTNTLPLELTVDDPLTGRVEVQVYHWQSHQLIEGVTLETPMEVVATRSDGAVSMRGGAGPILDVQASMPTDDPGLRLAAQQAVDLGDAVAIVRMALGAGSGVGGSNGDGLSPYQRLAADVDGDGELSLRDALGALRIASGLPLPSNQSLWRFVDERSLVPTASIETGTGADSEVRVAVDPAAPQSSLRGLVATVVGDVDGSFDLGDSATRLDASYFATLVNEVEGLDLARFGIGG